jgi:hypothetical protein
MAVDHPRSHGLVSAPDLKHVSGAAELLETDHDLPREPAPSIPTGTRAYVRGALVGCPLMNHCVFLLKYAR